jgi:phosphatidate cytidylyltransferase
LSLAGLIFGTVFTSRLAWFAVVATAVLIAQYELYRAMKHKGLAPAELLGLAAGFVLLMGAYTRGATALSFGLTMTVLATFLWFLVGGQREGTGASIAATLFGVVYVPFMGAHVVLMHRLPHGAAITICFIGLTAFYDIGAYASGVFFGKHLIAPDVSPKKSWEGAAGATLFVLVTALLVGPLIRPWTTLGSVLLAAAVAVLAPAGDLAESLVKRDLGVKDMGHILPGHGGLLDRIDALLFVAPAAFWLARWLALAPSRAGL